MSDERTALDVATEAVKNLTLESAAPAEPWHTEVARAVLDALGVDPDAPMDLLVWHATHAERYRCLRIVDDMLAAYPESVFPDASVVDVQRDPRKAESYAGSFMRRQLSLVRDSISEEDRCR